MSELKPCPFCGGKARFTPHHQSGYEVCCETCFARMHIRAALPQSVIEAWNTRATPPLEPTEGMIPKEQAKKIAVDFFCWWWNQEGTNTEQAFEEWWDRKIAEWMNTNKGA